ncbi:MAG: hypothetical protein D4R64_03240 [Porphyromonadaceae bacterium]|nr:MAG: hypothetical protein D4R64_03240 [Porphyromonadaceae bacterium]
MKKLLILASMLILIGVGKSMAGQADLFSYDAVTIENQMAQLDQLEGYVLDNPGITLGQMATDGNALASMVSDPNGINGFNLINEKVLGIPSFLWGCVFSWVGVLVVYLMGQDKAETKSAIIGCVVGAVAYSAFYGVYYFALSGLR